MLFYEKNIVWITTHYMNLNFIFKVSINLTVHRLKEKKRLIKFNGISDVNKTYYDSL